MIEKIKLKFGSSPSKPPLEIDLKPITVFVGPNNSGKSKILSEIESFCQKGIITTDHVILSELVFDPIDNVDELISASIVPPPPNTPVGENQVSFGTWNRSHVLDVSSLKNFLTDSDKRNFCNFYIHNYTIRLDGANRIQLVNEQALGDVQQPPKNVLAYLFQNVKQRELIRSIFFDSFKKYLALDITNSGHIRLSISETKPKELDETSLGLSARDFHKAAQNMNDASDGMKAFVGIIATVIAGVQKIVLIDEAEAFLHPPLASKLGKELSKSAADNKRLFVSTHSSNFLMGCIQSGVPMNIVRLTYSNNKATARILEHNKILKIMRNPLLRSAGVLSGLFYEYVIVTESDSDRCFYQEINERLLEFTGRGIPNCLFLNAQNKQTVHEIMGPLREMGIPCAAIVDVDILKEGGDVWKKPMKAAGMPPEVIPWTHLRRSEVMKKFTQKGIDFKTKGGVDVLNGGDKKKCNDLFNKLNEYGIFPVRKGEIESWLKHLRAPGEGMGHGKDWLVAIFKKMGENPNHASYLKPSTGDVWRFMGEVKKWLTKDDKKGMPE